MNTIQAETSRLRENLADLKDPREYLEGIRTEGIKGVIEKLTNKCEGLAVSLLQRLNAVLEKVKSGNDFLIHNRETIIKLILAAEKYAEKNPKLNQNVKTIFELAHHLRVYLEKHQSHQDIDNLISNPA